MKKILILVLLVVFGLALNANAATKARSATFANGIEQAVAIGDVSSGDTAEVSSSGSLAVGNQAKAVESTIIDHLIYTGACHVQGVYIKGAAAGDYAAIYDGTDTTGTCVFDPSIDATYGSLYIDCKGAPFATGIYVDVTDTDVRATVVYDY